MRKPTAPLPAEPEDFSNEVRCDNCAHYRPAGIARGDCRKKNMKEVKYFEEHEECFEDKRIIQREW